MHIPLGAVAPLLSLPSAPTTQADLIRHTVSSLSVRGTERRLTILVDDAHLLDDASATLVQQLALAGSVFVVITIRSQMPVADPITSLWKDGHAERLELDVLGLGESTAVAASILGGPVQPSAAITLFEASGGNPLFLQQLVASARDAGVLVLAAGRGPAAGGWRLQAPLPVPSDLVAAVETRLHHLDEADRSILELLALGEPLDAQLLEELAGGQGVTDGDRDERLERLESEGLIVATPDRRRLEIRLAHPMYAEMLRMTMPTSWANRARVTLANAVMSSGYRRRDDALRIALWHLGARVKIPSSIAQLAARQALLRFDAPLAEQIMRLSDGNQFTPLVAPLEDGSSSLNPDDLMLLATIAAFSSRADDANEYLDQVDSLLDTIRHDGRLRSQATVLRFDVMTYTQGRFAEAFALEVPSDGDPSVGAALTARKAIVLVALARPQFAEQLLATVPSVAAGTHADLWVSIASAMTSASLGRLQRGRAMIDRADAVFERLGWDPSLPDPAVLSYVRIRLLQHDGCLREAAELAERAIEFESDRWSQQGVAWIRMAASSVYRAQGRPVLAAEMAETSASVFERTGSAELAAIALSELAAALATADEASAAAAAARRCDALGVFNFYNRITHAWAIVASGSITDGLGLLCEALASRRGREAREELLLVLDIVRLGRARDVVDLAAELAVTDDGRLAAVVAAYAAAAAADDGEALEASAATLAAMGFTLAAGEAAVSACAAHLRHADRRRSQAFTPVADELRARLDGVRTPGMQPATMQAALAPREREVAGLAAAGGTSRAIADQLGLSQRTVESYVQNAFDKLGLASRNELALMLASSR